VRGVPRGLAGDQRARFQREAREGRTAARVEDERREDEAMARERLELPHLRGGLGGDVFRDPEVWCAFLQRNTHPPVKAMVAVAAAAAVPRRRSLTAGQRHRDATPAAVSICWS
jgi:hypothetical protein